MYNPRLEVDGVECALYVLYIRAETASATYREPR